MEDKKTAEANECIRQAEKGLKTSLLKWTPDYEEASSQYARAATCFKTIKQWQKSRECHLEAAKYYTLNESYFSSAKSYEQAAMMSKEMGHMEDVVSLMEKSSNLFRQHGVPDTAALTLERAGKIVEESLPEKAAALFAKAAEVVMLEDRPRQAAEYTSKAARLLVKLRKYDEAVEQIQNEMNYLMQIDNVKALGRLYVALILVNLIRDDQVAASKSFKEGSGYMEMDEINTMTQLLDGFDEGDHEMMSAALNSPFIKHMDTEYAKLARTLQNMNPEDFAMGFATNSGPKVIQEPSTSLPPIDITAIPAVTGNAAIEEVESYSGGLM